MWTLVVEDFSSAAAILEKWLKRACPDVQVAGDGAKARESLSRPGLHAASVDIRLPGGDGFEIADRIRLLHPRAYVAFVTGFMEATAIDRAFRMGVAVCSKTDLDRAAELVAVKAAVRHSSREPLLAAIEAFCGLWSLSEQESQFLRELVIGSTRRQIQLRMHLEESTIESTAESIVRKSRRKTFEEIRAFLREAGGWTD